jgi:hypothetical protein
MGAFENPREIAEAKREGWLTEDGRLTQAGKDRFEFEKSLMLDPGEDPRAVGRE